MFCNYRKAPPLTQGNGREKYSLWHMQNTMDLNRNTNNITN